MLIILSSKMSLKSITEKIRRTIFGVAMLSELYKMNKEEIAEKIAKLVLIVAGLSLLYFVAYLVFPFSPEEGSIWETLSLISIVPIIIGFILLAHMRHDYRIPYPLRVIGAILFIIFILIKLRVWRWFN